MIEQHGTTTVGSLKQGTARWRMVASGALVAVAVGGAIGLAHLGGGDAAPTGEPAAPGTRVVDLRQPLAGAGSGPAVADTCAVVVAPMDC